MSTLLDHIDTSSNHAAMPADVSSLINLIERAASDPAIDADKMEKLVDLYERLMKNRAKAAFSAAFIELQAELPEIAENGVIKVGETIRSRYAQFEDINDVIKPLLIKHGFGLMFKPRTTEDGKIHMQAVLKHRDGHDEDADLELPADTSGSKNSVQSMGSSGQYAKRYLIVPMLNITTRGVDDDGQAGGVKTINEDQVMELQALITKYKANQQEFLNYFKIPNLTRLPIAKHPDAIAALNKKYGPKESARKGGR